MTDPTVVVENVERVAVERERAPQIPMPDHPVRHERWYQLFNRLARPTLDWITNIGVAYALVVGPAIGRPLDDGYLVQVLLFAGAIYGIKSFDRVKGVA